MKPFTAVADVLLAVVAMLQLVRILMNWEVMIGGMLVPTWASGIACVVAGGLAVMLWREHR